MKRCLLCNVIYDEDKQYCEMDGAPLFGVKGFANNQSVFTVRGLITVIAVSMVGVIAGSVFIWSYNLDPGWQSGATQTQISRDSQQISAKPKETRAPQNLPAPRQLTKGLEPGAPPVTTPESESLLTNSPPAPNQSSEAVNSPAAVATVIQNPAGQKDTTAETSSRSSSEKNEGGNLAGGSVVIRFTDGASIEADEAWRDSQGAWWYKRRGMTTQIHHRSVASIDPQRQKPQRITEPAVPATVPESAAQARQ